MKPNQALHQANLSRWAELIKEQTSSGLNIREWCKQNGLSYHAYNYWKHLLKQSCVDSALPDIVPIAPQSVPIIPVSRDLYNSRNLHEISPTFELILSDGIKIDIPSDISDEKLFSLIKAVRHA